MGLRRATFTFLLAAGMAAATFASPSLGILGPFIVADLGIDRGELGFVIAVSAILGAVLSPVAGRVADRVGGRRALLGLFVAAATTFALFGLARSTLLLVVGGVVGAAAQALANPATNKLIAEDLPPGARGTVTGIKQSGVQAGIFLGGVTVPSLAVALGWRGAYVAVAAIPLVLAGVAAGVIPQGTTEPTGSRRRGGGPLPEPILRLAVYGFLLGLSGAVTFLVPLYAVEVLGFDPRVGGAVVALMGLVAVPGRILWSRRAERTGRFREALAAMAALSVAASTCFWASSAAPWLVWVAAVATAAGSSSWNSVGMVAVMAEAGPEATGRASGVVLFGFLAGLGVGPPLYGRLVDLTGGYEPMWVISVAAAVVAVVVALGRGRPSARIDP